MSIATCGAERRVLLRDVSWATFRALATESRGGRLAYDRGRLEIMSPSYEHENVKGFIGRLVEAYAEECEIDVATAGSTTLSREDLERGIESDECYYIANAPRIRGKSDIDLPQDPAPDLAIEIDITRSSIDKLSICAALGIREVWLSDGSRVTIYVLRKEGKYRAVQESQVLPQFPVEELQQLLQERGQRSETALVREFRGRVRSQGAGKEGEAPL